MAGKERNTRRQRIQWMLLWIVVVSIGLGWKYPLLGYSVPLVMITGMVIGVFRGRYVCGNLCPRGSFLDRIMRKFSPMKNIPPFMRGMGFRWFIFSLLMSFMLYRGLANPTDISHWGQVFWTMCAVTTGVAFFFSFTINSRTWCSFCPIGTVQNALGGARDQLQINGEACKNCGLCEKVCTLNLPVTRHRKSGFLAERDCLKCYECVTVCPSKALSRPGN